LAATPRTCQIAPDCGAFAQSTKAFAAQNCASVKQGNAMKKIIAVAALIVAGYAAPTVSVQAASAYPSNCLVLPLLQAECRELIKSDVSKATGSAAAATTTVASATVSTVESIKLPVPMWWNCTRAEGSGHLYDCE
jgi:hypothetical protein